MRAALLLAGLFAAALLVPSGEAYRTFNGVASYAPANTYDAPIFRQFAFVEGIVTQYHVLSPETFFMDQHKSRIFQFPACATLDPVLESHSPQPGDGGFPGAHDAPTRRIVDVVLASGCSVQPRSVAEVEELALAVTPRALWVNAPVIPRGLEEWTDEKLFNGPPFRPRLEGWMDGEGVQFITYETSWDATWLGSSFPANDADVYIVSYGAMFRPGFSILNVAVGSPHHSSLRAYSPIWRANCIVDADDQKCMLSVNQRDPAYYQCISVADCLRMKNSADHQVRVLQPNTFTHINCPMVSVDLNGDNYISAWEELTFPDLWVNGPVIA